MEIVLLADHPEAAEQVALWYFDKWSSISSGINVERVLSKVSTFTNRSTAPMIILAKQQGSIVGAAQLKIREMEIYPDYEFWIGGVYVEQSQRGKGIGSILVSEVINRAKLAGIKKIHLQTEDFSGGLYSRHGFKPIEEADYKGYHVLVMVADTRA